MKETIYLLIFLFLLLIFHDLCITIKEGMSNNNTKAEKCKKAVELLRKADAKINNIEMQIKNLEASEE